MSALPVEPPPSGDHRAAAPARRARRATPLRQLIPNRNWLLPDGDWTFPGGGESFSGEEGRRAPATSPATSPATGPAGPTRETATGSSVLALPPRPGATRPSVAEIRLATAADEAWLANVARARFAPAPDRTPAPARAQTQTQAETQAQTRAEVTVRLTRRGRLVLALALALLAALVAAGLFAAGASAAQASGPAVAHGGDARVFVQPGDTLWSIAQRIRPGADPQTVVQGILQANHLASATVTVGQRLWVPRQ
jgi:nucleoid-associated protein YgaU